MKKFTSVMAAAFGCMALCSFSAQAQTYMEPARLDFPTSLVSSFPPSSLTLTWDQYIEFIDPQTDENGDEFVTVYAQLGDGDQLDVNAYIMELIGDPEDPTFNDEWLFDVALYNIDELWDFDGETITVTIPAGVVMNREGALNIEQEFVFTIMPGYYGEYTVTPEYGATLSDGNLTMTVSFDGNPINFLEGNVIARTYYPEYIETALAPGEAVTINADNELVVDFSSLPSGEYEIVVPEGLVLVTVDDEQLLSPEIWLEYVIENDESGVKATEARNDSFTVYNLQGIQVMKNSSSLSALPAGIYVVNGKKIVVRK